MVDTRDPRYEGGNFEPPPVGRYTFRVDDFERRVSKAGNQMISFKHVIAGGQEDGAWVYDICTLTEKALWRLVRLLHAVGFEGEIDEHDNVQLQRALIGQRFVAEIEHDEYDGKVRAKIRDYLDGRGPDSGSTYTAHDTRPRPGHDPADDYDERNPPPQDETDVPF